MSSEHTPAQPHAPKPRVFIHVNHKQILGAIVGKYSLEKHSAHADKRPWLNNDLQSFTPLRFMPPELMGYRGRAVVIDPDVFAVGDIWELLTRDMEGNALLCRPKSGNKGKHGALTSSVMLLDCARLTHWRVEEQFNEMFTFQRDYMDWISLKLEDRSRIGLFEDEWNDFDRLTPRTKLLHTTKRRHQPWKTGLPIDFRYIVVPDFLPPEALARVNADYPAIDTATNHDLDNLQYGAQFSTLLSELRNNAFGQALGDKFGVDLTACSTTITVRRYCEQSDGNIHTDHWSKVITVLVYFNESWEHEGGRLRMLRSPHDLEDYTVEVKPLGGQLLAFRRTDQSWHGHKPFVGERRMLQYNFLSSSRFAQLSQKVSRFGTHFGKRVLGAGH